MASDARAAALAHVVESIATLGREVMTVPAEPFTLPAGGRLNRRQLDVLFIVAHGHRPVTPGILAEALGVTAGAITQLVDGLRTAGLLEQTVHPDDARSRVIRLSGDARRTVEQFEQAVIDRLAPRFAGLDDDQLHQLADLLDRTRRNP